MVASEAVPFAKTGGLADVLGGLPRALVRQGHHVDLVIPRYRGIDVSEGGTAIRVPLGGRILDATVHATSVDAIEPHWIAGTPPILPARLAAKTRYRMADAACTVAGTADGLRATFDAPQFAPTPGQYLVLYDGDTCLGGAVIASDGAARGETSRVAVQAV